MKRLGPKTRIYLALRVVTMSHYQLTSLLMAILMSNGKYQQSEALDIAEKIQAEAKARYDNEHSGSFQDVPAIKKYV